MRGGVGKNFAEGSEKNLFSSGGWGPWFLLRKKALSLALPSQGVGNVKELEKKPCKQEDSRGGT